MADIKIKYITKKTIKAIDKSVVATERFKDTIVKAKEKGESNYSDNENINEDGVGKIKFATNKAVDETAFQINKQGKKSLSKTKDNIIKSKIKIKAFKENKVLKSSAKNTIKNTKTGIKTSKAIAKKTQLVVKESSKASQRAVKLARETAKKTIQGTKLAIKATISAVKAIIAGVKALIALLIAGGWVVLVVIIIICMIALLVSSIFGIFFSSEETGSTITAGEQKQFVTMNSVITDINKEFTDKLKKIQDDNPHDELDIHSDRAEWKEVLAVYSAKISGGENATDVITLNDEKVKLLKEIFWEMNSISYETETTTTSHIEIGWTSTKEVEETITLLKITILSKSVDEMATKYNFTAKQKEQMTELLKDEYATLWSSAIYGTSVGSPDVVKIALSQVGNVGGEPYWSWYGYNSRVEWCAVFVSWVANEAGFIQSGIIPKFAGCETGINFFKAIGQWKEVGFIPKPGDIIFFDWESDGSVSHVGIVEKVENGRVYTVEGNSTDDMCRQKDYSINSNVIFGYGTPAY